MKEYQHYMATTVRVLSYLLRKGNVDPDGDIELHFASDMSPRTTCIAKYSTDLQRAVESHSFTTETFDLATSLGEVVTKVIERGRPCSIYVLTDGLWGSNNQKILRRMEGPIERLTKKTQQDVRKGENWAGIQFIRFFSPRTPNEVGIRRLKYLDDELEKKMKM